MFLWMQHFDREYVCDSAVYSDVGISSLTHCMGFEKLPFCE